MDWPAPVLSAYLMPALLKTNRLCQDVFRFTSLGLAVGARLGPQLSMAAAVDTKDCASCRGKSAPAQQRANTPGERGNRYSFMFCI